MRIILSDVFNACLNMTVAMVFALLQKKRALGLICDYLIAPGVDPELMVRLKETKVKAEAVLICNSSCELLKLRERDWDVV